MATYGIDIYGRSLYGTAKSVQFSADPFVIHQYDYGRLSLTWNNPPGSWNMFRLVRNLYGYPATYNDGDVLIEAVKTSLTDATPSTPGSYDDSGLVPGRFYYYSIFVCPDSLVPGTGTWWRAGNAMSLSVGDHNWQETLWSLIPRAYKRTSGSLTDQIDDTENYTLKRFLDVFGYQLDVLQTEYDVLTQLNDADRVSYEAIEELGQQFGVSLERELGPRIARNRVKNATYVAQEKGTTQGIQSLISAASGWVVDVAEGINFMINADQSSFVHPSYPAWDQYTNWPTGQIVSYNGNFFQAKTGGAYGAAQAPALTRTTNTWWTVISDLADTTSIRNPRTLGQSTWGNYFYSQPVGDSYTNIRLGTGIQSVTDPTVYSQNALVISNGTGATSDIGARSVTSINAPTWSSVTAYVENNFVTYGGNVYRALAPNTNMRPDLNGVLWKPTVRTTYPSIDPEQYILDGIAIRPEQQGVVWTASIWAKNRVGSSFSTPGKMEVDWYDEFGNFIAGVTKPTNPTMWDSFKNTPGAISGTQAEVGGGWTTQANIQRTGLGYVVRNTTTPGVYISVLNGRRADCVVGVTVRRFATTGVTPDNGIVVRWTDNNNNIRVGKSSVRAFTTTTVAAPAAPTLTVVGTAGTSSYFYKITATNAAGETIPSSEASIATANATLSATNYVRLNWSAVTGATGYKVYRSTTTGTEKLIATVGNVLTYNDQGGTGTTNPPGSNTATIFNNTLLVDLTTLNPVQTYQDGDRMALKVSASNLTLYKNNVVIWNGTATVNQTATFHGIWESY